MNMDTRIETKYKPMYGCHSDLSDKTDQCPVDFDYPEKACEGCKRKCDDHSED